MQKSSRIAEISTKVVGGGYFFMFTLYIAARHTHLARACVTMLTMLYSQTWKDMLMTWDPENFGGVDNVRVPARRIWTPDIVLYN